MTREKRLEWIEKLVWDYATSPEDILYAIEHPTKENEWLRQKMFVRSFERMKWQDVVRFWGIETCKRMDSSAIRGNIRPSLRNRYDYIFGILRGEAVSVSKQYIEDYRKIITPFLSDRWYNHK